MMMMKQRQKRTSSSLECKFGFCITCYQCCHIHLFFSGQTDDDDKTSFSEIHLFFSDQVEAYPASVKFRWFFNSSEYEEWKTERDFTQTGLRLDFTQTRQRGFFQPKRCEISNSGVNIFCKYGQSLKVTLSWTRPTGRSSSSFQSLRRTTGAFSASGRMPLGDRRRLASSR